MNFIAATLLSVLAAGAAQTDTVLTVTPGARLNLFNFGGSVDVRTWTQDAVRIRAAHAPRTRVEIQRKGPILTVSSRSRQAPAGQVNYEIQVPTWIPLNITGINNEVMVDGVDAEVLIETVRGGVQLKGGKGLISLRSIEGGVRVEGARGRVQVSSVNDGVMVLDVIGEVVASTVNGNIVLDRVVSNLVQASSANGDLHWDGDFKSAGRYHFGTHNGDIVVVTGRKPNATVSVETFSGDFESSFPVVLRQTRRRQGMNFTMGDGSAVVDFESFQGAIRLLQSGTAEAKRVSARRTITLDELRRRLELKRLEIEEAIERRHEHEHDDD